MSTEVVILIISFVSLLLLNVPIAVCLGVSTVFAILALGYLPADYVIAQRMSTGIGSFPLLAIPFFIMAGILMGESGMAQRLMDFASALMSRFRGGLSYVNTLTCMLFGSLSGSAAAAISSVGAFMIPQMEKRGYPRGLAVALTTTSATTGLLIPPSNIMIVYAVVAGEVSVAAMFLAGVLPGVVVGLLIMAVCFLLSLRQDGVGGDAGAPLKEVVRTFLHAVPSLSLIAIVLGGILGGIFSATEASAIAAAYALFLGVVIYRKIPFRQLPDILVRSARTTSVVMFLVGTSQAMSWFLAYESIPENLSAALLSLSENPVMILLLINLLLLMVGAFMDMTPAVLIFTPIFLPVVMELGLDPVHFGIILIANLCIGLCTPPVGTCLFIGCSVGNLPMTRVINPMLPFFLAMLIGLMIITFFAPLSMWLPQVFGV